MDGAVKLLKELLTIRSVNGRDDEGAVQNICASISNNREFLHIYSGLTRHTPMCWRSLRGSRMALRSSGTGIWTRFLTEIPENGRLTRRFRWNGTVFSMPAVPAI